MGTMPAERMSQMIVAAMLGTLQLRIVKIVKVLFNFWIIGNLSNVDDSRHSLGCHFARARNAKAITETGNILDENSKNGRNIMLYWDDPSPTPPAFACSILDKWQAVCPSWDVSLYNRETSTRFLNDKFGVEIVKFFEKCAIPSMRSDFFRVFWALSEGGVYRRL